VSFSEGFACGHQIILTARAVSRAIINKEIIARIIIKIFAQRDGTIASVGSYPDFMSFPLFSRDNRMNRG
jgi:hypothetical protein